MAAEAQKELLALAQDDQIGPDAWGDVYLSEAIDCARQLAAESGLEEALRQAATLDEPARVRFLQALLTQPAPALLPKVLALLGQASPDLAEVVLDNLRDWPLDDAQRQQLQTVAAPFRQQSRLLDLALAERKVR